MNAYIKLFGNIVLLFLSIYWMYVAHYFMEIGGIESNSMPLMFITGLAMLSGCVILIIQNLKQIK